MTARPTLALALSATLLALPVQADPVDARAATELLYRADRVEVARYSVAGLDPTHVAALTQIAQEQKYYGAVAIAPDLGILSEATVMAANYHSIPAARSAALADCNARRTEGADCVIVMELRPAGFEPRDLTMSADATEGFNRDYRRASGTRALAISASTGQWGIGRGENAGDDALAACAGADGADGADDCAIVIAD